MPSMIGKYYLDLNKVSKIDSKSERMNIHSYYRDMLYAYQEGRLDMCKSMMNTLINSGYLLDHEQIDRDRKLNDVFDGDKS
jgi:hypothetical protein